MALGELLFTVVVVSSSGVLYPGPLFFATLARGVESGVSAGLKISLGHMAVEFPLVLLLFFGLGSLFTDDWVTSLIGLVGGAVLVLFGAVQVYGTLKGPSFEAGRAPFGPPVLLGVSLTALNPYFILWWLTVGGKLIADAAIYAALAGVVLMYASHIWMDYAWLAFTAYSAKKGRSFLNAATYRALLLGLGVLLVGFGFQFILSAL
ncbi:MAG: LysE family transporter [Candidatus Geothermarchaeales archaeon]